MLASLIRSALRGVIKEPAYLAVRVVGLAVGVATASLALAFVRWELGFDRSAPEAELIYRVVSDRTTELPSDLDPVLDADPRVRSRGRISGIYYPLLTHGDRRRFPLVRCVDGELVRLLDLEFVEGDRQTALTTPHSVLVTESLKRFYFGDETAIGRRLRWDNGEEVVVTGVVSSPRHSHLEFDVLAAWHLDIVNRVSRWRTDEFARPGTNYVLLDDPDTADDLAAAVQAYVVARMDEGWPDRIRLQRLTDIYLDPPLLRDQGERGDPWLVGAALTLAVSVVLLAAINFVNITVAQFSARTREIGARKSLGASGASLFAQFMGEALVVSLAATLLGLGLVLAVARFGADLAPVEHSLPGLGLEGVYWQMLALGLAAGLVAGLYPAWVASRWHVVAALRGGPPGARRSRLPLRDLLLLLQLALCLSSLTAGMVVYGQSRLLLTKDLGFRTRDILMSHMKYPQVEGNFGAIKVALEASPYVAGVVAIEHFPIRPFRYESTWYLSLLDAPDHEVKSQVLPTMPGYLDLFEHRLLAGRSFESGDGREDVVILNETAARALGASPQQLVDTRIRLGEDAEARVVGVTSDFHFEPLQRRIIPLVMVPRWADHYFAIRVVGGPTPQAMAAVHRQWGTVLPDFPLNYTLLADEARGVLEQEEALADLLVVCTVVITAIALVGVFAMTSYASRRRAKEIAVRRVLGASLAQALHVIVRPYLRLVVVAIVLITPPTLALCLHWLQDYPERLASGWVVAGGALAAVITLAGAALSSGMQAQGLARQAVTETLRLE